ncbi:MAG: acyltransferase family protein [Bacteroidaceae bacterium]|nr:acyltransferase family protein [Bacteroidaceae bacterium]
MTEKKRIVWVDWLKTLGMFLIVYGHTFPPRNQYIYAFSVPLFFILSGFLTKRENSIKQFWLKIFYNYIMPILILSVIVFIYKSRSQIVEFNLGIDEICKFIFGFIIGQHSSLHECWFVYTLAVLKIIYQYTPPICKKTLSVLLFVVFSLVAMYLSAHNYSLLNSVANVFVSYQFFLFGLFMRRYKSYLNAPHNKMGQILLFVICLLILFVCGKLNGHVWMYNNGYGRNILLFFMGGIAGTVLIYLISKSLMAIDSKIVRYISQGNIIILGLHFYTIGYVNSIFNNKILTSVAIMLIFIPVIWLFKRYAPYALGIYRLRK